MILENWMNKPYTVALEDAGTVPSAQLAVRWPRAFDTARQAGMREMGELPEAHFTVRIERKAMR